MRVFAVCVLASTLALAACGVDPDAVPPGEEAPFAEEESPATLDLQSAGIIVPAQGGFERLDIPFGSSRIGTEATLQNVLGAPLDGQESTGDCWLDQVRFDGLTVNFDKGGEFVGYYATAPFVPELSRAEMLADPAVNLLDESTIEGEFTIGEAEAGLISGVFAGEGGSAGVSALWAGENCIFR